MSLGDSGLKTLLIGLDAADWDMLQPALDADDLPRIAALIDAGAGGTLQSTLPAHTPTAWASIVTGLHPENHGVYDMLYLDQDARRFIPTDSRVREGTEFWHYLNRAGLRVGLANVPFTYPVDPFEGFAICGFGTPRSAENVIVPDSLATALQERFGEYELYIEPALLRTGSPEHIFDLERQHQRDLVDRTVWAVEHEAVDVLVMNLMLFDHANHLVAGDELLQRALIACDQDIGRVIDAFQPDHVLLISDHGSRRTKGEYWLHRRLSDHGYLMQQRRSREDRLDALNFVIKIWLENHGWSGIAELIGRKALLLQPIRNSPSLLNRIEADLPGAVHFIDYGELDWDNSPLIPGTVFSGLLYLNPAAFDSAEASQYLYTLMTDLESLQDPQSSEPLISAVHLPAGAGQTMADGPGLILDIYSSDWNIVNALRRPPHPATIHDRYFADNYHEFGVHRRNGFCVLSGPHFKGGQNHIHGHVVDVPSTLFYLCDLPQPEDWQGTPLYDAFLSEGHTSQKITYQAPIERQTHGTKQESGDSAALIDHLRALGYVD